MGAGSGVSLAQPALLRPVYLPSFLYTTATMALVPMIPALVERMGGDLSSIALVAGARTAGELCADLPAAWVVTRLGERRSMILATLVGGAGLSLVFMASHWIVFALGLTVMGAAGAVFHLARQAYISATVPFNRRGKTLSLLGGAFRLAFFVGPLLAAVIIATTGTEQWVMVASFVCVTGALAFLLASSMPAHSDPARNLAGGQSIWSVARSSKSVLLRAGLPIAVLSALRSSRTVLLPIWGSLIGLSASDIAAVLAVSALVELSLFYLGGSLMDRIGRRLVVVPCLLGLSVGHLIIVALMAMSAGGLFEFSLAVAVLSLANAPAGGIQMVLGADLTPPGQRPQFLAIWRLLSDGGQAAAPLLITVTTLAWSIAVPVAVLSLLGFVAAGFLSRTLVD
jgi:MFS family permease